MDLKGRQSNSQLSLQEFQITIESKIVALESESLQSSGLAELETASRDAKRLLFQYEDAIKNNEPFQEGNETFLWRNTVLPRNGCSDDSTQ